MALIAASPAPTDPRIDSAADAAIDTILRTCIPFTVGALNWPADNATLAGLGLERGLPADTLALYQAVVPGGRQARNAEFAYRATAEGGISVRMDRVEHLCWILADRVGDRTAVAVAIKAQLGRDRGWEFAPPPNAEADGWYWRRTSEGRIVAVSIHVAPTPWPFSPWLVVRALPPGSKAPERR